MNPVRDRGRFGTRKIYEKRLAFIIDNMVQRAGDRDLSLTG